MASIEQLKAAVGAKEFKPNAQASAVSSSHFNVTNVNAAPFVPAGIVAKAQQAAPETTGKISTVNPAALPFQPKGLSTNAVR